VEKNVEKTAFSPRSSPICLPGTQIRAAKEKTGLKAVDSDQDSS
jgi:hypothetical protein